MFNNSKVSLRLEITRLTAAEGLDSLWSFTMHYGSGDLMRKVRRTPKFTNFTRPSTHTDKNKKVQLALSLKVRGDKVPRILKCRCMVNALGKREMSGTARN